MDDAIGMNNKILFSELSVDFTTGRHKGECDGSDRLGNYTCLQATFTLTRDLGYYIAQMYVPTTLALMFSWVGVWLPEELMEGRLTVAITVLLTLSTDSAGSQEHLPTVSYMKVRFLGQFLDVYLQNFLRRLSIYGSLLSPLSSSSQ